MYLTWAVDAHTERHLNIAGAAGAGDKDQITAGPGGGGVSS